MHRIGTLKEFERWSRKACPDCKKEGRGEFEMFEYDHPEDLAETRFCTDRVCPRCTRIECTWPDGHVTVSFGIHDKKERPNAKNGTLDEKTEK